VIPNPAFTDIEPSSDVVDRKHGSLPEEWCPLALLVALRNSKSGGFNVVGSAVAISAIRKVKEEAPVDGISSP
jgi:hypothetical protein